MNGGRGRRWAAVVAVAQIVIARPPRVGPTLANLALIVCGRPGARGQLVLRHRNAVHVAPISGVYRGVDRRRGGILKGGEGRWERRARARWPRSGDDRRRRRVDRCRSWIWNRGDRRRWGRWVAVAVRASRRLPNLGPYSIGPCPAHVVKGYPKKRAAVTGKFSIVNCLKIRCDLHSLFRTDVGTGALTVIDAVAKHDLTSSGYIKGNERADGFTQKATSLQTQRYSPSSARHQTYHRSGS